jgi:hypothetical protein
MTLRFLICSAMIASSACAPPVARNLALPLACLVHPAGAQTAATATPVVMPKPNCGEKP